MYICSGGHLNAPKSCVDDLYMYTSMRISSCARQKNRINVKECIGDFNVNFNLKNMFLAQQKAVFLYEIVYYYCM